MALNIKDRETEEVVRQLAKRTGRSITETVKQAAAAELRRLDTDHAERVARMTPEQLAKLRKIQEIIQRARRCWMTIGARRNPRVRRARHLD